MDHDTNHSDVSESDNGQDCSTGGTGAINLSAVRPASAPTSENAPNSRNTSKTSSSSLTCTTSSSRVNGDNTDSSDRQVSTTLCQHILSYGEFIDYHPTLSRCFVYSFLLYIYKILISDST